MKIRKKSIEKEYKNRKIKRGETIKRSGLELVVCWRQAQTG